MGTSLGYGQGMEYTYSDLPQPSQALPLQQLRQARLQQLREERMRRQQRRMAPDITRLFQPKAPKRLSGDVPPQPAAPAPPQPQQMPPQWGPGATPSLRSNGLPAASSPIQMSPALRLPAREVSPAHQAQSPPDYFEQSIPGLIIAGAEPQAAAEQAQDTGMLQKVNIRRATFILTGAFIASRVLGLLRTSMFAFVFGTTTTSDAYLQAFLIPDLIFNIVAGGALSSAFIPVFTNTMVGEQDEKKAWHIASTALNLAIAIMMALAFIAIIIAPWVVPLYNPSASHSELALITSLTRIMLLQAIVLGGGVIVNSVLNARQNFLLPAIGTVLYNVGLIMGLLPGIILAYHNQRNDTLAVYAATIGVILGALVQVGFQIPGLFKLGMRYTFSFDWKDPGVIQIGRQMVPRVINAAMLYFSIFVDRILIGLLVAVVGANAIQGLITQYYQSLQLVLLPLGIFGMSVSTAAFPTLAENVTKGRLDRVQSIILDTLRSILFMSIPSSVGLIVLGLPVIQVLLEHGAFTLNDAISTSVPLACFAIGLTGLTAVEILTRSFYAMRDSRTPVIISVAQFILKIALSLIIINIASLGSSPQWKGSLGLGALAFSTSIAGLLEAIVLFWLLHQRIGNLQWRAVSIFVGRILLASLAMALALLIIRFVLDSILVTTDPQSQSLGLGGTVLAFIKLLIELAVGTFVYLRATRLLGIEDFWKQGPVKRVLDRLKLSWL
jgi:putative peptidoglycan lipid II flippase